ncbi:acetoacetyl-CoA synthase [Aspergillus cavernicola]|uniref:Acetoacetyl-CoA synthase n=1 Tax=Aspergillus cavernicola TaxID=176166 RepID=A0ABR4IL70_9EURO
MVANRSPSSPQELWRHSAPDSTQIYQFMRKTAEKHGLTLDNYDDLWQWSVSEPAKFWEDIWLYTAINAHKSYSHVMGSETFLFPRPQFFEGARLNFAENLLYPAIAPDENAVAVIAVTEEEREYVSWKDLRERVRQCANALKEAGLQEGDRVAGFLGNHTNTVVAMLAATSIGAFWTGVSPDTGVHAVLERLKQIEPKILFADNASLYNGKVHSASVKIGQIVSELFELERLVVFETIKSHRVDLQGLSPCQGKAYAYHDFISTASNPSAPLTFASLPPEHPVYILYSSGTTGAPKPIVHGSLGTLLQHKKEHVLHCDIRPGDRLFYFTTVTWMMWHWLVSGLASGATIVLYDGSPFRPLDAEGGNGEMAMLRLIDELEITHFGTSAKYLSMLEQAALNPQKYPHRPVSLATLRAIFSTGSPLAPSTFEYVYSSIHSDIMLGSITGGTDILSLFCACCPILPVYKGEIQCRCLAMAVSVYDYAGTDISSSGEPGDLVCTRPFPAQPVMFWPPGPTGAEKYRKSYFDAFGPSIWHHGDFVRVEPQTGGVVMLGRSDGVLKPAGVRFGSAEIYNILLKHFADEVEDSLCVGRRREGIDTDETVVLFVKLASPTTMPADLASRIQATIRKELSPRHVPGISHTYYRMRRSVLRAVESANPLTRVPRSVSRGFSTVNDAGSKDPVELDQITTLPNGIRVATESLPGPFAGVGVYVDAGSRYEDASLRGVSHIMDRLAFKSTKTRTADEMIETLEGLGGNIQCASSRESLMYQSASFNSAVPTTLGLLAETIRDPLITEEEVLQQLATAEYEITEIWAKPELILPELVHTAAYKDNTLGNPLLCPRERLGEINKAVVEKYRETFFQPDRMVVAFAGVPHIEAVKLTEQLFGDMRTPNSDNGPSLSGTGVDTTFKEGRQPAVPQFTPTSTVSSIPSAPSAASSDSSILSKLPFLKKFGTNNPGSGSTQSSLLDLNQPSHYTGGFLSLPTIPPPASPMLPRLSYIHLAFEALPISDPDIYALATLQTLLGGGGSFSAGGPGKGMYSRLYTNVLNQHGWVESCMAFNHGYKDSGVFGISASCSPTRTTQMLEVMCRELQALTLDNGYTALQPQEVNRAKNQLRSSLLMNLESRMVELEDLGRQVQVHGRKVGVKEMCKHIDSLTVEDLRRVARKVFGGQVQNEGQGTGKPTVVLQEGELEGHNLRPFPWGEIQERIARWKLGRM